jgi:hypothetical protein
LEVQYMHEPFTSRDFLSSRGRVPVRSFVGISIGIRAASLFL